MATGIDLGISGLASGFDWKSFIDQITAAQRAPETALRARQGLIQQRNAAFTSIKEKLTALQDRITALKDPALFDTRTASVSDSASATAAARSGATPGTYNFQITRLATASRRAGTSNIAAPLSTAPEVATRAISEAGWPVAITAGTFTVNNSQVTIAATDTLQQVFDKIAAATNNQVTANYNPSKDQITLTSPAPIVLGSATDTSNFLQAARLNNNGTSSVTSAGSLGSVRLGATLSAANLATAVTAGAGEFKINGVSITYNTATDTVASVLDRINNSSAGVTATYDALNDRFLLASKVTGNIGIALQDVTGNFLTATGLAAGTLERGQDLVYSVNGGPQLTSHSNTILEESSGIAGLSVTALKENTSFSVSVGNDTDMVKAAIEEFVKAYNEVVSYIGTQTASSTDANGKITAGTLAGDYSAESIAGTLRSAAFASLNSLSAAMNELADLGFQTNGYDKKITLKEPEKLEAALGSNLAGVKQLFSDATNGLAAKLDQMLTKTLGEDGELRTRQTSLTKQIAEIDAQIERMEKSILAERERMTRQFIEMEAAQARITQQLQYLAQNFG